MILEAIPTEGKGGVRDFNEVAFGERWSYLGLILCLLDTLEYVIKSWTGGWGGGGWISCLALHTWFLWAWAFY